MTITVFHLSQDLPRDVRLAVSDPLPEPWCREKKVEAEAVAMLRKAAALILFHCNGFAAVATIEGTSLDSAYALTNSFETVWWKHPGQDVTVIGSGHRSTSVGDVLVDGESGLRYVVASVGFVRF